MKDMNCFPIRVLFYKEDHQMYISSLVLFITNCQLPVNKMSQISYEVRGAGRISTSFEVYQEMMFDKGYMVNELARFDNGVKPISSKIKTVIGAYGNY